jgi:hypothetical protein
MVKIEGGKSTRWYENHCCICKRELKPQQARVNGTATMMDDSTIAVLYCEPCAKTAKIQQACESVKKGVMEG